MKDGEWKERKYLFFFKLNMKYDNIFYTDIYNNKNVFFFQKKVWKNVF